MLGVFVVAIAVRLSIMLRGGGLDGLGTYDDGVYYAAADALIHGRLPYRDFLFIQPPLIAVVTAPFAVLGAVTTDMTGFVAARVAFITTGGASAALVAMTLRRFGSSAAFVGGIGYAVFYPAVFTERTVLLEPLGTLGLLLAILLLQRSERDARFAILAGLAAGLATGSKIWFVVPAVLLVLMTGPRILRYLLGLAVGGVAIYLPFLLAAPQRAMQEIVLDQLGRGSPGATSWQARLTVMLGARETLGIPVGVIATVLGVPAVVAVAVALATRGARTFGVLAVATTAVLLLAPSWYSHYAALTAPTLMLCAGVAASRIAGLVRPGAPRAVVVAVLALGLVAANAANDHRPFGNAVPHGVERAASVIEGCVTADDPGALIAMNVLSRDLRDPSCVVWPDVTGWTYDPHDLLRSPDGGMAPKTENRRWQVDVLAFLRSGNATILIRRRTGLSSTSRAAIDAGPVLFARGSFVVRSTAG